MQYTMNAAWVVSDSYIASYLFPKFFKTLVIIMIPILIFGIEKNLQYQLSWHLISSIL